MAGFLACDWGTTNLRAWRLDDDGAVLDHRDFALGVAKLAPGEAERRFHADVRPQMEAEGLPAILCGMVGSTLGWKVAPYVECPIGLEGLRSGLLEVEDGVLIVPGLKGPGLNGAPEVLRGEETQVFGWMAGKDDRQRGRRVVCHPGTHAKWVVLEDGRVVRFLTAMTGELYDVLRRHSVLRSDAAVDDGNAFLEGVAAAGDGDALATSLFTTRTRVVAGSLPAKASNSYLSGLLIGAEVASVPPLLDLPPETTVALIGEPVLCQWYTAALATRGFTSTFHDGDQAVIAGLTALHRGALS
jgi:2-dehydro-3-deoxygalactonokinase